MDNNLDNFKKLIESLKSISFWERIFNWKKIKNQLVDAVGDIQKLVGIIENLKENTGKIESHNNNLTKDLQLTRESCLLKDSEIANLSSSAKDLNIKITGFTSDLSAARTDIKAKETQINNLSSDIRLLTEKNDRLQNENSKLTENTGTTTQTIIDLTNRKQELEIELSNIKNNLDSTQRELNEIKTQNTKLNKDEEFRNNEHSKSLESLIQIRDQIQSERAQELAGKNAKEIERIKQLKDTWSKHQENARNLIKAVCQRHTVEYLEKVPFRGEPDNTLKICNEYVILDAKSPGSDDITNFPTYLKDQAERAKKYAKQENVKSDIFFVVPSNTLDHLNIFSYRHADYNVYIISVDALEPIILNLKKIEEYEFAEQLDPQDRENICRILGRFAHLSKRRIQIDSFFAMQFIELAYKCEADLPKDILESVKDFETTEKMNPPLEKRAKAIPIGELEKDNKKIFQEADNKGILMADKNFIENMNAIPLYKKNEE